MARPYLSEAEFLDRVAASGYSLRGRQEYVGVRARYSVVCPHHPDNIWTPLGSNLINKSHPTTCPICSDEKQSKDRVFTHEQVAELFEKDGRGFKVRDGSIYKGNKYGLSIVCPYHPEYKWFTRPLDVVYQQKRCPVCIGHQELTNVEIDKRLVGRNIKRISDYASGKAWFKCTIDGHEWQAHPTKVTKEGGGCPMCSGNVPWTEDRIDNWLLDNMPSVVRVSETYQHNDHTHVKLSCKIDGYYWDADFSNTTKGYGCPCCRSLKHWNTELARMWLAEHRPDIEVIKLDGVSKKSKFFCKTHNKPFERRFRDIREGYGCDECSGGGGFKTSLRGYLYYAKIFVKDVEFYKIGITNRKPEVRVAETRHDFELLHTFDLDGKQADHVESVILYKFKHLIQTEHKFSGSTECFTEDIRKYVDLPEFVAYYSDKSMIYDQQ